jgi:glucose/arabinose dehydrogenase
MTFLRLALVALGALALAGCGGGDSSEGAPAATPGYRFVQIASGFDQPVHVTAVRNQPGTLYVVEQPGRIRIVRNGRITGTFLDLRRRVVCCGEQGLLSVAFHPRYARNRRFFVFYTAPENRIVEYRNRRAVRTLLNLRDPYGNHNGGQLTFGPDGRLYAGTGDSGGGGDPDDNAQDLGSRFGKLLAFNVDRRGTRPLIVGFGLRNPWRFSFDRQMGDLYIGDVGQNSWEEVNFTPRRSPGLENYGWDVYEGRSRFENKPPSPRGKLVFPVAVYSLDGEPCAVAGGFVYRGRAVPAARGRYFYGDTCAGTVWSFQRGRARNVRRERFSLPQVSSFGEDANGELYAVTLDGKLWQLRSS